MVCFAPNMFLGERAMQTIAADTEPVDWVLRNLRTICFLSGCLGIILSAFVGGGEQDVGQIRGFDTLATLVIEAAIHSVLHYRVG